MRAHFALDSMTALQSSPKKLRTISPSQSCFDDKVVSTKNFLKNNGSQNTKYKAFAKKVITNILEVTLN